MIDLAALSVKAMRPFMRPAVISTAEDGEEHSISGVFESERADVESNVAASMRYTFDVPTVTAAALSIAKRDTLTVDGVVYTIVDMRPDAGGVTKLILKRYG